MVLGDIGDGEDVLVRLHSECLTGDALGSLRCDCGIQLRLALRTIAAERRGVLIYATGHEGRGIGLVNKLRAYVAQDDGADTVDANVVLGLPIDSRDYTESAAVLAELGRSLGPAPHQQPAQGRWPAVRRHRRQRGGSAGDDAAPPQHRLPEHQGAAPRPRAADRPATPAVRHRQPADRRIGTARSGPRPQRPPVRRAQVRADARRAHRHVHRRLQVDQRRGRAPDVARVAGRVRRDHGRRRHGHPGRSRAHRPDGVRRFPDADRARHLLAHPVRRPDPRTRRR